MHRQFWITAVMRWTGLEMPPPFVPVRHFGILGPVGDFPRRSFWHPFVPWHGRKGCQK
nr:MAG TPA_asm: hypothetical protein [Caudoviricetes sp.]